MAGLAGFGIGSALQGAQSAVTGSQAVTDAVSNTGNLAETITPDVLNKATEISQNIAQNPGKELPVVFVLLKFYQYILILVGAIFGLIYFNYFKNFNQTMESSD